jgi:uncharacterized protein (DUF2384 family)
MARKQPAAHETKSPAGNGSKTKSSDSTGARSKPGLTIQRGKPPAGTPILPVKKIVRFRVVPTKEQLIARATEVFANEQKALRWLGTPLRALEYATPISLLGETKGRVAVLRVLHKIEYGVL